MFYLIDPELATGTTKELLDNTLRQLGRVPNLYRALAHSPTALEGYLAFRGALQSGTLDNPMRERIALLTAQRNACDYCVDAHSFRSQKLGLTAQDIDDTRHARSGSPKTHAALAFVAELIEARGAAQDSTREALVAHGWTEAEIGEMVAHVALNVFSNYFKQVAAPTPDFPRAPELSR